MQDIARWKIQRYARKIQADPGSKIQGIQGKYKSVRSDTEEMREELGRSGMTDTRRPGRIQGSLGKLEGGPGKIPIRVRYRSI
jgi:hypothetical protein